MFNSRFDNSDFNSAKLRFLTAGHFLSSDNRQYLSESELLMGNVVFDIDSINNNIELDELTVYKVKSLPVSVAPFFNLSSEVYFGYKPKYTSELKEKSVLELSGGVGKAYQFHRDVHGYFLFGVGLIANITRAEFFSKAHVGLNINMLFDTKFNIEYSYENRALWESGKLASLDINLSWFPHQDWSITLSSRTSRLEIVDLSRIGFIVTKHF